MKYLAGFAIPSMAVVVAAIGVLVSSAPAACACGEVYAGKAAFHWGEMSFVERVRYKTTGYLPFDKTGERL